VLTETRNGKVTQRAFYSYRLFQRDEDGYKILHNAGRLFQEYIVDAYAQTEQNNLRFHTTQQKQDKLRMDVLQGITDAVADGTPLRNVGKSTILPSSFTGGPEYMQQLYHDAMAIVRSHSLIFIGFDVRKMRRLRGASGSSINASSIPVT
jgi:Helitron helicase-like domain at N-terminus